MLLDKSKLKPFAILPDVDDALEYVDRYDEEIAYADHHIGRFLDALERQGLLSDSLVVLTADHGENMTEHEPFFDHCDSVWEGTMRVPLMIRRPGQSVGQRIETAVSTVDVMPEILSLLGLPGPDNLDGIGLGGEAPRAVFIESRTTKTSPIWQRGVVQGSLKWVVDLLPGTTEIADKRLFDLARDPGEKKPLQWRDTAPGRALLTDIRIDTEPDGRGEKGQARGRKRPTSEEAEIIEALRALGYL